MWNVPAGLFNWLVPGTGLLPSLRLNFGTGGPSASSKRFKTQAIFNLRPWKRNTRPTARILSEF